MILLISNNLHQLISLHGYASEHKDLIKRLLTPDLSKRFGNLRAGAEDIKRHKWFAGVDWGKLVALHIQAPYVPKVAHEGDTSNFDQYPEDHEPYGVAGTDPYRDKFKDF